MKQYAKELKETDMEKYWLFVYECLEEVPDEWQDMKKNHVSFLKSEYR